MKRLLILILTLTVLAASLPALAAGEAELMASVQTPRISTQAVVNGMRIGISSTQDGASIYYTLDGSNPSEESEPYTGRFVIDKAGKFTVRAIAVRNGEASGIASQTVEVLECGFDKETSWDKIMRVSNTGSGGRYLVEFINLDDYTVYYTTGHTTSPTPGLSKKITDGPLYITKPTIINLLICREDKNGTRAYAPVLKSYSASQPAWDDKSSVGEVSPKIESYYGGKRVVLSTETDGADIYYRIEESYFNDDVTTADTKYNGPVAIERPGTFYVRAFAVKSGLFDSEQTSVFEVNVGMCETPTVTVKPRSDSSNYVDVTASVGDGSEIYYTTDGSNPNQNSVPYNGPRVFGGNYSLKFIAMQKGSVSSEVVERSVKTSGNPIGVASKTAIDGSKTVTLTPINENAVIYYKITDQIDDLYSPNNNPYYPTEDDNVYDENAPIEFNETGDYYIWAREWADGVYGPLYSGSVRVTIVTGLTTRLSTLKNGVKTLSITSVNGRAVYCALTPDGVEPEEPESVVSPSNLYVSPLTITETCYVTAVEVDGRDITDIAQFLVEVPNGPLQPEQVGDISIRYDGNEVTLDCADDEAELFWKIDGQENSAATVRDNKYAAPFEPEVNGYLHVLALRPGFTDRTATCRVGEKAAKPDIAETGRPSGNLYSLRLTSSTPGATVYYTTDGTVPSAGNGLPAIDGAALIQGGVTVTAVAVADGYADSEPAALILNDAPETCSPPFAEMGDVIGGKEIMLTTTTSDASIYYTTDGTQPTIGSLLYDPAKRITVTSVGTTQIRAIATKTGCEESEGEPVEITLTRLGAPSAQMGQLGGGRARIVLTGSSGASVYYTLDGSIPVPGAQGTYMYSSEFDIYEECVLTALLAKEGYVTGPLYQNRFPVDYNMVATPDEDDFMEEPVMGGEMVTVSSKTEGADVYYSLANGSLQDVVPNTLYQGPIFLGKPSNKVTVSAKKAGMKDSNKMQFSVLIPQAPMPSASVATNSQVEAGDTVVLSVNAPSGDKNDYTILYTTDGSAPAVYSNGGSEPIVYGTEYKEPIEINGDTRIRAVAVAQGVAMSDILELWYTVDGADIVIDAEGLNVENNYVSGCVNVDTSAVDAENKKVIVALYCGDRLLQAVSATPENNDGIVELDGFDVLIEDNTQSAVVIKAFVMEADGITPVCRNAVFIK